MTSDARAMRSEVDCLDAAEGPFWYSMYGLRVRSDLRLPMALPTSVHGASPAWVLMNAEPGHPAPRPKEPLVAEVRCHPNCQGPVFSRVYAGTGGAWLWDRSIATFHLSTDARQVDVYPEPGVDVRLLQLVVAGQLSIFVLHKLGYLMLHASAVVTSRGAVAFLGAKGQGKSTMAASFLRRGATLLTDDGLPLWLLDDTVLGAPGLPHMKVWPETAERTLHLDGDLPNLLPRYDKRIFALEGHYPFAQQPVPLCALFVLKPYDATAAGRTEVGVQHLIKRDAVAVLVTQTSWLNLLAPSEAAALLPSYARVVAQVPVRVLRYPRGFEHQAAVHARIMAELEQV